jgi:hypothetical protein
MPSRAQEIILNGTSLLLQGRRVRSQSGIEKLVDAGGLHREAAAAFPVRINPIMSGQKKKRKRGYHIGLCQCMI